MKIIEPSASIIEDDLAQLSIYQRIDRCASVCYQRPPKPTDGEARSFCRQMIARKHFVPLEMARVHLVAESCDLPTSSFVDISVIHDKFDTYVVSGSIRAFRETAYESHVLDFLADEYPIFFDGSDSSRGYVRFAEPHEIPWQHKYVAVRVVCSRAISHQLVRHRLCSILQESQRYCRYDGERFDREVSFVRPLWVPEMFGHGGKDDKLLFLWRGTIRAMEDMYIDLMNGYGLSPQQARGVLPNDCKTELIMYASLPEWMHILNTDTMRCSRHADPEMIRIMLPLREEFVEKYPEAEW